MKKILVIFIIAISMPCLLLSKKDSKKVQRALASAKVMLNNETELKKTELPLVVIKKMQALLTNNPAFVETIVVQDITQALHADFRYSNRLKLHEERIKQILATMQITNHADKGNIVLRIAVHNKHYFLRIGGQIHRDANAACTLGMRTGRALDVFVKHQQNQLTLQEEQELDTFKRNNSKTMQTISQIAFYQLAKRALALYNIKTIRIPVTNLIHVPARPYTLEDKNYIVVQEELLNSFSLSEHPELCKRVTNKQIDDLKKVIKFAGLWDIKKNLFLCLPTSEHPKEQLGLFDFEQPSCSSIDYPPYLDDVRRAQLAKHGLRELRELLLRDHSDAFDDV